MDSSSSESGSFTRVSGSAGFGHFDNANCRQPCLLRRLLQCGRSEPNATSLLPVLQRNQWLRLCGNGTTFPPAMLQLYRMQLSPCRCWISTWAWSRTRGRFRYLRPSLTPGSAPLSSMLGRSIRTPMRQLSSANSATLELGADRVCAVEFKSTSNKRFPPLSLLQTKVNYAPTPEKTNYHLTITTVRQQGYKKQQSGQYINDSFFWRYLPFTSTIYLLCLFLRIINWADIHYALLVSYFLYCEPHPSQTE